MNDLLAPLTSAQLALLQTIAEPMLEHGRWPKWQFAEAAMRKRGYNGREVLQSLPQRMAARAVLPAYGLVWYDWRNLQPDSEIRLTVAASVHLPEYKQIGWNFIKALRYMIKKIAEHEPDPFEVTLIDVTSEDLRRDTGLDYSFIRALPGILQNEPFNLTTSYQADIVDDLRWTLTLGPILAEYEDVTTVEQYVHRAVTLVGSLEDKTPSGVDITEASIPSATETASPAANERVLAGKQYVNQKVIDALEQKETTSSFSLDKLLQLINELNTNYALGNPYACHALLRAILDHIPPVFSQPHFQAVASNHNWSQTDKRYMKLLVEFRNQADDVMHRQIRKSVTVIDMHDVPQKAWINALLVEVAEVL
ncbi:hypothetical protein [Amycolatopsis samaneae]|uniref:Uncharacterized protein n=1 Tax=Amycolatopsis samaneae TaxID=664691 RepID=A0ABW5GI53_9PSEU